MCPEACFIQMNSLAEIMWEMISTLFIAWRMSLINFEWLMKLQFAHTGANQYLDCEVAQVYMSAAQNGLGLPAFSRLVFFLIRQSYNISAWRISWAKELFKLYM